MFSLLKWQVQNCFEIDFWEGFYVKIKLSGTKSKAVHRFKTFFVVNSHDSLNGLGLKAELNLSMEKLGKSHRTPSLLERRNPDLSTTSSSIAGK